MRRGKSFCLGFFCSCVSFQLLFPLLLAPSAAPSSSSSVALAFALSLRHLGRSRSSWRLPASVAIDRAARLAHGGRAGRPRVRSSLLGLLAKIKWRNLSWQQRAIDRDGGRDRRRRKIGVGGREEGGRRRDVRWRCGGSSRRVGGRSGGYRWKGSCGVWGTSIGGGERRGERGPGRTG